MSKFILINYSSMPKELFDYLPDGSVIALINRYHDFKYHHSSYGMHSFSYLNLHIIVSERGSVMISLMTRGEFLESSALCLKLLNKINSIISVNDADIKFWADIKYDSL